MKIRDSAITSSIIVLLMLLCFDSATAQETGISRGRRVSNSGAEATIMVNEEFLNSFLTAIFDNLREPSMPLTAGGAQPTRECAGEVHLKREVGDVRTAIHFENDRITGPLAFAGSYNSNLLGCVEFTGWADSELTLEFSSQRRAVVAHIRLQDIHLNNTPGILNGPLQNMVQGTIDRRYNPFELFTLEQLSTRANVQPAGGALRLEATAVRTEITPAALALHIAYRFVRAADVR